MRAGDPACAGLPSNPWRTASEPCPCTSLHRSPCRRLQITVGVRFFTLQGCRGPADQSGTQAQALAPDLPAPGKVRDPASRKQQRH